MNKYLSDKLKITSFILIVMVVLLHAYKITNFNHESPYFKSSYNFFMQLFISEGLARIAVPLFFGISGYLFFLKSNGTIHEFIIKHKNRIRSLLVPYILWSILGLVFYFTLQLLPISRSFFSKELISNYSFTKTLNLLLLHPIPYQLWFLRDLMLLVLLSPLIYWLIRYLTVTPIVLLFVIWLTTFEFNFVVFRNESILFFSAGAYLAITKNIFPEKKLCEPPYLLFMLIWIALVYVRTLLIYQNPDSVFLIVLLGKLGILAGIIAFWSLYDIIMKGKTRPCKFLLYLSSFSFFIYGSHEPILTLTQKGLFYITDQSEIMTTVNYLLAPSFTLIICILLGRLLKKNLPLFYDLINGGR